MILNHLVIGVRDFQESLRFYQEVLGYVFKRYQFSLEYKVLGALITHKSSCDLLLLPFDSEFLPCPRKVSFHLTRSDFELLFEHLQTLNTRIRAGTDFNSELKGRGHKTDSGLIYECFYITDPNLINIEFITEIQRDEENKYSRPHPQELESLSMLIILGQ